MDTTSLVALLRQVDIASSLTDETRSELAGACEIRALEPGKRMRPQDVGDGYLFLLSGQLVRVSGGKPVRITQEQDDAGGPVQIFDQNLGNQDFVIAEKPCQVLEIPGAALERAHNASVVVQDTELDATEGAFFGELYELITSNRLELPTMPEVALRIQELTNDPNTDLDRLTEVIQRDGTIAGALLHATNSPLFRASKKIESVRDAVNRLGFRNTRMLAMNMALRQAFKAKYPATREAMEASWRYSALQSIHSFLIADSLKLMNRERALLAGLVAGIGAVPIIQFVELREDRPAPERIQHLVHRLRNLAGVLVINYWDLGSDLVAAAERAGDWSYRASEPDYASITLVAEWATRRAEGEEIPDATEVAAFEVLGIEPPAPGDPITLLEERSQDLAELRTMFNV